jgi:hypothetical protein
MRSLGCRECCDMLSTGSQELSDYQMLRLCSAAKGQTNAGASSEYGSERQLLAAEAQR